MDELAAIVSQVLEIAPDKINDQLSREDVAEWDSFTHLLLVSEIEKRLGIKIPVSAVEGIRTYRDLRIAVKTGEKLDSNTADM
jgi:acyl carrier protein